jgi:hypothetical protein
MGALEPPLHGHVGRLDDQPMDRDPHVRERGVPVGKPLPHELLPGDRIRKPGILELSVVGIAVHAPIQVVGVHDRDHPLDDAGDLGTAI